MFTDNAEFIAVDDNDVVACDLEGELALLNLKNETYYSLDSVGAYIWQLLHQPHSIGAIHQVLVKEYEVDPERCKQDLLRLLKQLHEAGLIRVQSDAST